MEDLTAAEARSLLETLDVLHIGVIDRGEPYVTPISFVVIGDAVCFRTGPGRRLRALDTAARVCLEGSVFDREGPWQSVILWGTPRRVDDTSTRADVVSGLLGKYREATDTLLSPGRPAPLGGEPVVVAVDIDEITGRRSGHEFGAGTKPGRL